MLNEVNTINVCPMKATYLVKGLVSQIPGADYIHYKLIRRSVGGGETQNARYCYSVWMRHLISAWNNGLTTIPKTIVELGPGRSLGTGIMSLISGAEQYFALDSIKFSSAANNISIFDELVALLRDKTPIPDDTKFPNLKPKLDNYAFPANIFTPGLLKRILDGSRLASIKSSIGDIDNPAQQDNAIIYIAPWHNTKLIKPQSIDMIFSQSVLQYLDDLSGTYQLMYHWLKPGGFISHQVDLRSLGTAETWYGHWEYSDLQWAIMKGRKNYSINRQPVSTHLNLLALQNFKIVGLIKGKSTEKVRREKLANKFKNFTDEDISTPNIFVQAVKK